MFLLLVRVGKTLRLWDAADGALLWDNVAYAGPVAASFGGVFSVGDERAVVVSSAGAALVSVKDGRLLWDVKLPAEFALAAVSAQLSSDASKLFVLSGEHAIEISLKSGELSPVAIPSELTSGAVLIKDSEKGSVLVASVTKNALQIAPLETKGSLKKVGLGEHGDQVASIVADISNAVVVELTSGKRVVLKISSSLKEQIVHVVPSGGALVKSMTDDVTLFHAAARPGEENVQVTSYPLGEGQKDQFSWDGALDVAAYGGDVATGFIGCPARKKDGAAPRCRAVLVMNDDALIMTTNEDSELSEAVANRNVQWVREEALANIKQIRWVTPAETDIEKQAIKGIPSFFEEVELELKRLQNLAENALSLFENHNHASETRARKEPVNAHLFGFSKYIVALTESGKLFAIRTEASTIAWSVFVGPVYRLYVTRDQPALGAGSELLLVSNTSELVWMDGDNGRLVESLNAGGAAGKPSWVILLPKRKHHIDEEPTTRRAVAVVDEDSLDVSLYPAETASFAHPELTNFYFYRFDKNSNSLNGYVIGKKSGTEAYRAQQVWTVALSKDQSIVATSQHKEYTVVDSSVTITGDDSLLLKYLNPNLFGFAAVSLETLPGVSKEVSVLTVTFLDSVSGRVIHRSRHEYASSPVRMVQVCGHDFLVACGVSCNSNAVLLLCIDRARTGPCIRSGMRRRSGRSWCRSRCSTAQWDPTRSTCGSVRCGPSRDRHSIRRLRFCSRRATSTPRRSR